MRLIVATGRIETVPLPQPMGKSLPSRGAHRVGEVLLPGWIGNVDPDELPDRVLGAFEQEPPNLLVGEAVFAPMLEKPGAQPFEQIGHTGDPKKRILESLKIDQPADLIARLGSECGADCPSSSLWQAMADNPLGAEPVAEISCRALGKG